MTGLTGQQVAQRVEKGLVNKPIKQSYDSILNIILRNTFTYFNFIFIFLAALLIWVGSYKNLLFVGVMVFNALISMVQEIRSRNTLKRISIINSPKATVIRDGIEQEISSEMVVVDDVAKFCAGGQIFADAILLSGEVYVNESLLTGEADEVHKIKGDELLSGSYVVSGECYSRIEKVGAQSYAAKLTMQAKARIEKPRSGIVRSLNKLLLIMGFIIVPIAIAMLFVDIYVMHNPFNEGIIAMVAAVVGMIPEGLFLLTSVALAVSVMKLALSGVLTHDLSCIETLARVDVLCLDKTGTITENKMSVQHVLPLESFSGNDDELNVLISTIADQFTPDNITIRTLKEHFSSSDGRKASNVIPFSSVTKFSCASIDDISYVIGAPEILMSDKYSEIEDLILPYSKKGYRALLVGSYDGALKNDSLEKSVNPFAVIFIANPIRAGAKKTFEYFYEQGVQIKVISGDNPLTVSQIAMEAGILNADQYVDARILSDEELKEASTKYTVFGRVSPEQKKLLIIALKGAGHTVAMTGDGVNDVPALKLADCSVAMASGSQAASHASQLVLLNSDFSCMPRVLGEGRRVINNIQRSASLFIVKNIFSLLMALYSIITRLTYPLEPSQMTLVSTFVIGIPSFFLALEPNQELIKGHFLKNVISKALPAGIINFILMGILVFILNLFNMPREVVSTCAVLLMGAVCLMHLYNVCSPFNRTRLFIFLFVVAGFSIAFLFFHGIFGLSLDIPINSLLLVFLLGAISALMFHYFGKGRLNVLVDWIKE